MVSTNSFPHVSEASSSQYNSVLHPSLRRNPYNLNNFNTEFTFPPRSFHDGRSSPGSTISSNRGPSPQLLAASRHFEILIYWKLQKLVPLFWLERFQFILRKNIVQQGLKSHFGLALPQCIKSSTSKWVNNAHSQYLLKNLPQKHPNLPPLVNMMTAAPNLDGSLTAEFKNLV